MNLHPIVRPNLALTVLATSLLTACAQSTGPRERFPPPPEALVACKAAAAGSVCSVSTPHGEISGFCWAPEGKPLACKPKNNPPTKAHTPTTP